MTYGGGRGASTPQHGTTTYAPARSHSGGPRADPIAAILLLIAGFCGLIQYAVAGFPIGHSQPVGGSVLSGKQLLATLSVYTRDATATANVTRIAILVTAVGGGALVVLGLCCLLPVNHRPFGTVALIISLASIAAVVWMLAQAEQVLGSPMSSLLSLDNPGWYLMAATAVVGLFGAVRALGN